MEVSGVSGPTGKPGESAAARLPAPVKKAVVQQERPDKAAPGHGKATAQRVESPQKINPTSNRSGTRMSVDQDSKRIVAQILDRNNQVVKQIPPEERLKMAARMKDLQEQIFDEQV